MLNLFFLEVLSLLFPAANLCFKYEHWKQQSFESVDFPLLTFM